MGTRGAEMLKPPSAIQNLVDVSIYFIFIFCSGEGKGESDALGRAGVGFLMKIPGEGGGVLPGRGGRAKKKVSQSASIPKYLRRLSKLNVQNV